MSVQLKVQTRCTITSNNVFRVQMTIIEAIDISFDVFVFTVSDEVFSHVATVYDLETWPASKAEADNANLQSYRGRDITVDFDTPLEATTFKAQVLYRLRVLTNHWQEVLDDFDSSSIVTIT